MKQIFIFILVIENDALQQINEELVVDVTWQHLNTVLISYTNILKMKDHKDTDECRPYTLNIFVL